MTTVKTLVDYRYLKIPKEQIPVGLCQCGCGGKTRLAARNRHGRGQVKGEPLRCLTGHKAIKARKFVFSVDPETECWLWGGGRSSGGYGTLYLPKRGTIYAHRYFYEHFIGKIPVGLEIDHLCRTRECVAPGHLEAVTHEENMRRKESEGLDRYGR